MPYKLIRTGVLTLALGCVLAACETNPAYAVGAEAPKAELQFVDLQGFDRDLANSLSASLEKVDVTFYDRITPSALPDRLQQWMASVEAGGGSVKVVPPKSTVTAKNPFLLISAASTLWSTSKMVRDMSAQAKFKAAETFDAEIILKADGNGVAVVDKVVFVQRKK